MARIPRSVIFLLFFFKITLIHAQLTDVISSLKEFNPDTLGGWQKESVFFFNTSQTSLTNWASGGRNSLSLNAQVNSVFNYRKPFINWDNTIDVGYGIMNQSDGTGFVKTDDRLELSSKYGYKIYKDWYYSALITLRTQINKGYYDPDDSIVTSRFLAPGYLVGAIGFDLKQSDFSVFISPLTMKMTLVLDQTLADSGYYGVDRGQKIRNEMGGFLRMLYRKDLSEDILFNMKIDLFSNYLNNPQNIDIGWEMRLTINAYKLISASISTYMLYDDDTILEIDENRDGQIDHRGPRIQFKELFGVGITFTL